MLKENHMTSTLSICIPTYNSERLLEEVFDRVLSISPEDVEIVVCDDGSTDGTWTKLQDYDDERLFRFQNSENIGFDRNMVKCVEKATGDYLFFLSDEDYLLPSGFSRVYDIITNTSNIAVLYGNTLDFRSGKPDYYSKHGYTYVPQSSATVFSMLQSIPGPTGWLRQSYLSGTVLKKSAIDLSVLSEYIGCNYIASFMAALALQHGDLCWIDEPLCGIGPEQIERSAHENEAVDEYRIEERLREQNYRLKLAEQLVTEEEYERVLEEERKKLAMELSRATFKKDGWYQNYHTASKKSNVGVPWKEVSKHLLRSYANSVFSAVIR